MLSRSNSSIVSLDIRLISISIVKHLSPKCQKCKEQEPSRDHKFSILENVAFLRDCTSATLPHFEVALVGAKPLHLACARPGCHSNAPLGRSLLRKRGLVGACLPQTLLGRSMANRNCASSKDDSRSRERRLWLRYYPAKQRGNPPALPKVERCTGKEHGRKAVSCLKTIGHD